MEEDMILITIRDADPIHVDKKTLTESGTVFKHLLEDLSQKQLEIEDFAPDTVKLFVKCLEEKSVENIEFLHFRELHKLSVVFDVVWLIDDSRSWLKRRIAEADNSTDNSLKIFLFQESFYIYNKWNLNEFMNSLALKLRFMENSSMLSHFFRDFESLKTNQLYYLLHLAGSNTRIILEIIIQQININQALDDNTRYLLQNINLPLCLEQDEELYDDLFRKLSQASNITNDDLKIALGLSNETTKQVLRDRSDHTTSTETTVYDTYKLFDYIEKRCDKLIMINDCISEGLITSMYDVIEVSVKVIMQFTPSTGDIEEFVELLENFKGPMQKVSNHYVKMILSVVKFTSFSRGREKSQLIKLLEMIKDSEQLSSKFEIVQIIGELTKGSSLATSLKSLMKIKTSEKYIFKYKHPGLKDCEKEGECGFMIKFNKEDATYELCKEPSDYQNSNIHTHDVFKAGKMNWYGLEHGESDSGIAPVLPKRWRWGMYEWGYKWFRGDDGEYDIVWQSSQEQFCVDYDISEFLVAKF